MENFMKKALLCGLFASVISFSVHSNDGFYSNTNLLNAIDNGDDGVVSSILSSKYYKDSVGDVIGTRTPLMAAIMRGNNMIFDIILSNASESDMNAIVNGQNALTCAISHGNVHAVEKLLEKGADANLQFNGGGSALLDAINKRDADIVRLLIEHGADPLMFEISPSGKKISMLDYVASMNKRDETSVMIKKYLQDAADRQLAHSVEQGHFAICQFLVENGANPRAEFNRNLSIMDYARQNRQSIYQLLGGR